jgi:hypothetical protein
MLKIATVVTAAAAAVVVVLLINPIYVRELMVGSPAVVPAATAAACDKLLAYQQVCLIKGLTLIVPQVQRRIAVRRWRRCESFVPSGSRRRSSGTRPAFTVF